MMTQLTAGSFNPEELTQKLSYGKYQVGFKVVQKYDYSRTFGKKYDNAGKVIRTDNARPVQIYIWYPGAQVKTKPMLYKDYFYTAATDVDFSKPDEKRKMEAVDFYINQYKNAGSKPEVTEEILKSATKAYSGAKMAEGKFPLIMYSPGGGEFAFENSVLIEYLVSHGYVVAAVPSIGAHNREMVFDYHDSESQLGDVEFAYGYMQQENYIDKARLGLIGFCFGSGVGLQFAARNCNLDALVTFYNYLSSTDGQTMFESRKPLDFVNPNLEMLSFDITTQGGRNDYVFQTVKYNDLTCIDLKKTDSNIFTSYFVYKLQTIPNRDEKNKDGRQVYLNMCNSILAFLNYKVKNQKDSEKEITVPFEKNKTELISVEIRTKKGFPVPPKNKEFIEYIKANGLKAATELYQTARKNDPQIVLFDENTINMLGYEYIGKKQFDQAILAQILYTLAYPLSANAFDSLGEAYYLNGDKEKAIRNYQKSLELNPQNDNARQMLEKMK